MNKAELSRKLAGKLNITIAQAAEVIGALFDPETGIIAKEVAARRSVDLAGFGSFRSVVRAGRKGRNPATGEEIDIASKRYPKFKPGTTVRAAVDASKV